MCADLRSHRPEGPDGAHAARLGEDHGKVHLAVAESSPCPLHQWLGIGWHSDHIIDQLKGDAEIAAIGAERFLARLPRARDHRGTRQAAVEHAAVLAVMILRWPLRALRCGAGQ